MGGKTSKEEVINNNVAAASTSTTSTTPFRRQNNLFKLFSFNNIILCKLNTYYKQYLGKHALKTLNV